MTEPPVVVEIAASVATVSLNRPEVMNSLDQTMRHALLAALNTVAADPGVRCVVLTGRGRAFSAGQDLKQHARMLADGQLDELWSAVPEQYNPIAEILHQMPKPVIAAVNGVAAGAGAALAFLADYRIVAASAGINVAFAGIGLSCDTGTSWTLPRLVGPTRAMDLLLNPRTISAGEALDHGIASEVVADAEFGERLTAVAQQLASGPTLAYAAIRRSIAFAASHSLPETLAYEAGRMRETGATADHRHAVDAFLAKEKPSFNGR